MRSRRRADLPTPKLLQPCPHRKGLAPHPSDLTAGSRVHREVYSPEEHHGPEDHHPERAQGFPSNSQETASNSAMTSPQITDSLANLRNTSSIPNCPGREDDLSRGKSKASRI